MTAGVAAGGLGLMLAREARLIQSVELSFGRDLTPDLMRAVVDRFSGLHQGSLVVLDVVADHAGIRHVLHSDQATIETLKGSLRAVLPSLHMDKSRPSFISESDGHYNYGRSLRLRGRLRTLRDDEPSLVSAGLLASLQPLGQDERILYRWWLRSSSAAADPRSWRQRQHRIRGTQAPAQQERDVARNGPRTAGGAGRASEAGDSPDEPSDVGSACPHNCLWSDHRRSYYARAAVEPAPPDLLPHNGPLLVRRDRRPAGLADR